MHWKAQNPEFTLHLLGSWTHSLVNKINMNNGLLDIATLKNLVASGEIDTVLVCMIDMQGRLIGKRVTGHFFVEHAVKELHVCDYLLAVDIDMEPVPGFKASSWDKGYGDFGIQSDEGTLRNIPWLPGTALIIGDCVDHHGDLLPHAPRSILKKQLERAASMGYVAKMGSELELYVFDETFESAHEKSYRNLKTAGWYIEDYHIFQTTKEEPLIRAIRNGMDGAGIPVEFSKGEWGPGQEEINLRYAEALEMADRHVIYKNGVKEIAYLQDKAITFMAKWNTDLAGSSCHIHSSLWNKNTDEAVFFDDTQPYNMSKTFQHYLAGQLKMVKDMCFFLAPFINSYKRFQSGSFAPTKAIWSFDNRTAGFRVLGAGPSLRAECRIPGADVNPYLAYSTLIGAGLYGIENELELEPIFEGNAYASDDIREVPKTLREALDFLEQSKDLRAMLSDEVVDHYVHAGRWDQKEHDRRVTDLERIQLFERG